MPFCSVADFEKLLHRMDATEIKIYCVIVNVYLNNGCGNETILPEIAASEKKPLYFLFYILLLIFSLE